MLLDAATYLPTTGCADRTEFPFPTQGVHLAPGDGHAQPGLDTMTKVTIGDVTGELESTTTDGKVEIERRVNLATGQRYQYLDHMIEVVGVVMNAAGETEVQVKVWYLGNTFADAPRTVELDGDRAYFTRDNMVMDSPAHHAGTMTATWYAEVISYNPNTGAVNLLLGKEIEQGDTFYVDGVRYDVPAVFVVDEGYEDYGFKYITLRTPIPKSDPAGSWAAIQDPLREEKIDGQWQVQENSHVTTQWIVEVDNKQPIWLDPPFNHESYTMVDDTDVLLNAPYDARNPFHLPYGPTLPGLPDAWGQPLFPHGERFLTEHLGPLWAVGGSPYYSWAYLVDAVSTDFLDTGITYADNTPKRLALTDGINPASAWGDMPGQTGLPQIDPAKTNFYWVKEWHEGRYTTKYLQIPVFEHEGPWGQGIFESLQPETEPDRFTEFVMPDRPNPASSFEALLEFNPGCSRGDLFEDATCSRLVDLLGGDYLLMTSLYDAKGDRFALAHVPIMGNDDGAAGGAGDSGGDAAGAHAYDLGADCVFSDDEVLALVSDWGLGLVDDTTLLSGVAAWGQSPDAYC